MNQDTFASSFVNRHIGLSDSDISDMLNNELSLESIHDLIESVLPQEIISTTDLRLPESLSEESALSVLKHYADTNDVWKSFIGHGYYNTFVPKVILRNILENPSWYTQYTPYQAEIAQGRLEALLVFQTMISDLTGMEVSNSSLLDEGTALAEAMTMVWRLKKLPSNPVFAVHSGIHPGSLEVLQTRAEPLGIKLEFISSINEFKNIDSPIGLLLQNPCTDGLAFDIEPWANEAKVNNTMLVVATDLLSLCLMESPGSKGADIVVGNAQRFGVPLGYGGPHAAFMSCRVDFKREIPGRIVGISKDINGKIAYRLALQTREQHIKRERATSNICTAQVLLAIMSGMYAVYHGPDGLKKIAQRVSYLAKSLAYLVRLNGNTLVHENFFDTIHINPKDDIQQIRKRSEQKKINLRYFNDNKIGISLDETTCLKDIKSLLFVLNGEQAITEFSEDEVKDLGIPASMLRQDDFLNNPAFTSYRSETEMLRYLKRLEGRDLSLAHSMIPLGSCTMKLNATSEMIPLSWDSFSNVHPYVPTNQVKGYQKMCAELESYLAEITGLDEVSLQPNAGSQGEYAGLLVIKNYLKSIGQSERNICLIPSSAHGTNPASANMAGMKVVVVKCDTQGNVDIVDLKSKIEQNKNLIAALMVTYPSTHGVFEEGIVDICKIIHDAGGLVYMDGANLNAQVGLCKAGEIGVDVCHLNLHKTFCIPHGGGGPGMGPIACKGFLKPFLPGHSVTALKGSGAVSSAPYGSASILLISWMYIRMMGSDGLKKATTSAILSANYVAERLKNHFKVLYTNTKGMVAHECIIDLRHLKRNVGIDVSDIAKRLMDYGFHAPTVSFPVPETLMIEPTESESREELDRFCEALITIKKEIDEVETGAVKLSESALKNAPHTLDMLISTEWPYKYSKEKAVYPLNWVKERKFWPFVGRIDNAYGDRNLFCQCLPPQDDESKY